MKKGILDRYVRTPAEMLTLVEEESVTHVALVLAELMQRLGVTQRQLAERVGVTEGRISQILHANSNPTVKTLARLGHALGQRFQVKYLESVAFEEMVGASIIPYKNPPRWNYVMDEPPVPANAEDCAA
jgi:transcriptional regulator with XRE-family HTH domain